MKNIKHFPPVSKELLEELEKRFPDRVPDPVACPKVAYGSVLVIRFLRSQYNSQQTNILEN
jgi:hypothetical protein